MSNGKTKKKYIRAYYRNDVSSIKRLQNNYPWLMHLIPSWGYVYGIARTNERYLKT